MNISQIKVTRTIDCTHGITIIVDRDDVAIDFHDEFGFYFELEMSRNSAELLLTRLMESLNKLERRV